MQLCTFEWHFSFWRQFPSLLEWIFKILIAIFTILRGIFIFLVAFKSFEGNFAPPPPLLAPPTTPDPAPMSWKKYGLQCGAYWVECLNLDLNSTGVVAIYIGHGGWVGGAFCKGLKHIAFSSSFHEKKKDSNTRKVEWGRPWRLPIFLRNHLTHHITSLQPLLCLIFFFFSFIFGFNSFHSKSVEREIIFMGAAILVVKANTCQMFCCIHYFRYNSRKSFWS